MMPFEFGEGEPTAMGIRQIFQENITGRSGRESGSINAKNFGDRWRRCRFGGLRVRSHSGMGEGVSLFIEKVGRGKSLDGGWAFCEKVRKRRNWRLFESENEQNS
jgi:hypothetical protein